MSKLQKLATGVVALVAAPAAMAFDPSAATTYIAGDMTTGVTAIGGAIIAIAALAVGFKWAKGMLFS